MSGGYSSLEENDLNAETQRAIWIVKKSFLYFDDFVISLKLCPFFLSFKVHKSAPNQPTYL